MIGPEKLPLCQKDLEEAEAGPRLEKAKTALQEMARLRDGMAQRGKQRDSVEVMRELREER